MGLGGTVLHVVHVYTEHAPAAKHGTVPTLDTWGSDGFCVALTVARSCLSLVDVCALARPLYTPAACPRSHLVLSLHGASQIAGSCLCTTHASCEPSYFILFCTPRVVVLACAALPACCLACYAVSSACRHTCASFHSDVLACWRADVLTF